MAQMTTAEIAVYVSLALGVIAIFGHVKVWMNSGEKELTKDVTAIKTDHATDFAAIKAETDEHKRKLIEHDRRIQSIESDMKHLPDRESQHRLELALEKVNGRLDTLNETLKPIKANGEAMNELLLERAKQTNV
jgi:chromosome segregation ATPase